MSFFLIEETLIFKHFTVTNILLLHFSPLCGIEQTTEDAPPLNHPSQPFMPVCPHHLSSEAPRVWAEDTSRSSVSDVWRKASFIIENRRAGFLLARGIVLAARWAKTKGAAAEWSLRGKPTFERFLKNKKHVCSSCSDAAVKSMFCNSLDHLW